MRMGCFKQFVLSSGISNKVGQTLLLEDRKHAGVAQWEP